MNAAVQKCEDWTFQHDNEWTHIRDENKRLITTFYRKLTYDEVYAFRAGWGVGREEGRKIGYAERAETIRNLLGI